MPVAELVHSAHGRSRIRVPQLKRQAEAITDLAARLREHPGIEKVETSPLTGSLVFYHHGPVDDVLQFAKFESLFELREVCPTTLIDTIRGTNLRLKTFSLGRTDLASITVLGLLAAAAFQATRGQYLPPAISLLSQALTLLAETQAV